MDALITAAAQALSAGDPLGALNRIALRDDAPALALRGIAMAQLGDFTRARALLKKAARAFGPKSKVARARCIVAEFEIALAARDLLWPLHKLQTAQVTLTAHNDLANAIHAHYLSVRYLLLSGQIKEAETRLSQFESETLPPALKSIHELALAGIAKHRLQAITAQAALKRASIAAQKASIPALITEIENLMVELNTPVARLVARGNSKPILLAEIESLLQSDTLVINACSLVIRQNSRVVSLATRPVLFALTRLLAEAWPEDVSRDKLISEAFRLKLTDDSLRARLRVEIGRLRMELQDFASITATAQGYLLTPEPASEVMVLAPPVDDRYAAVIAVLSDGEAWSSSAIAQALGISQRSVQRALDALLTTRKVQFYGQGRARRWLSPPVPGFATTLLLPHSLSSE